MKRRYPRCPMTMTSRSKSNTSYYLQGTVVKYRINRARSQGNLVWRPFVLSVIHFSVFFNILGYYLMFVNQSRFWWLLTMYIHRASSLEFNRTKLYIHSHKSTGKSRRVVLEKIVLKVNIILCFFHKTIFSPELKQITMKKKAKSGIEMANTNQL